MRGKIFDDFMMLIGYYIPIFIIILAGVIFILTSIFKYYNINNPSQYYISIPVSYTHLTLPTNREV